MIKLSKLGDTLIIGDKKILLSRTESGVIRVLLEGGGEAVDVDDIIEGADVASRGAVRTHIWRLRGKGVPIQRCCTWGYKL